ncbi:hypothetical protein C8A01DRAFT_21110 [Parachaetomium inaequale]|uniref:Uncharacterized protein n=1 Tax=Parachaetomium inaequale TaxID=2588326 RepID=A0AAN6P939_9PEZI|nr:hypothetical protein C8A01DRAFT_21110 [Parachaetomium inaequale]
MAPTWFLTSVPYNLDDISLGSLISDIRQPHQDVFCVQELAPGLPDVSVRTEHNIQYDLQASDSSWFELQLSRLINASLNRSHDEAVTISAFQGRIFELRNPKAHFSKLCERQDFKEWFQEGIEGSQSSYMVVGYRTFDDASAAVRSQSASQIAGRVEPPVVDAVTGVPGAGQALGLNVAAGAGHTRSAAASSDATFLGERIFAICYRKVTSKVWPWKPGKPQLDRTNQWVMFSRTLRGVEDEAGEAVEVDLEDSTEALEADDVLHSAVTKDGETTFSMAK